MRDFFALPMHEKLKVERSADNARGFTRSEMTKQKLDHKQCFDVGNWKDFDAKDDDIVNQGLNGVNRFPEESILPDSVPRSRNISRLNMPLLSVLASTWRWEWVWSEAISRIH